MSVKVINTGIISELIRLRFYNLKGFSSRLICDPISKPKINTKLKSLTNKPSKKNSRIK